MVYFSYRLTIEAYPTGGGSYTVASENLGTFAGLFAASALMVDYVLVVGIEAVRHPRRRRWLDELGRLKGGRPFPPSEVHFHVRGTSRYTSPRTLSWSWTPTPLGLGDGGSEPRKMEGGFSNPPRDFLLCTHMETNYREQQWFQFRPYIHLPGDTWPSN